jgi:hypothetical protein
MLVDQIQDCQRQCPTRFQRNMKRGVSRHPTIYLKLANRTVVESDGAFVPCPMRVRLDHMPAISGNLTLFRPICFIFSIGRGHPCTRPDLFWDIHVVAIRRLLAVVKMKSLVVVLIMFQLATYATGNTLDSLMPNEPALTFTSPSLEASWNSSGPHSLAWFIDSY